MKWLEKSFKQGVPVWMVRSNVLTQKVLGYGGSERIISNYDSLHIIYQNAFNIHLRKTIDSLYELDQKYTNKVNDAFILFRHTYHGLRWLKNNKNQVKVLHEIIKKHGFPGNNLSDYQRILRILCSTLSSSIITGCCFRKPTHILCLFIISVILDLT
jgi:hypothetical protein